MSFKIVHKDESGVSNDVIKSIADLITAGANITINVTTDGDGLTVLEIVSSGGGDLPIGTENQTLRYNGSNELESNSLLQIEQHKVFVNGDDSDATATFEILHKGASNYGFILKNEYTGDDISLLEIWNTNDGDLVLLKKETGQWNFRIGDSFTAIEPNVYIESIKPASGSYNVIVDSNGLLSSEAKPTSPSDVSDLTDTTNIIPVSHSSFLPADHLFYNLQVTPALDPVITDFEEIGIVLGNSTFKVNLKANKRYAFEARILVANVIGTVRQFQIKLICPTGWGATLFTDKSEIYLLNYPDVSTTTTNQYKIVDFAKNTIYGYFIDDDINQPYLDLYIKGIIDTTGEAGTVTFDARNTFRDGADNSNIVTIKTGSYIKAIETEIN